MKEIGGKDTFQKMLNAHAVRVLQQRCQDMERQYGYEMKTGFIVKHAL
jgi:hypothetical protein